MTVLLDPVREESVPLRWLWPRDPGLRWLQPEEGYFGPTDAILVLCSVDAQWSGGLSACLGLEGCYIFHIWEHNGAEGGCCTWTLPGDLPYTPLQGTSLNLTTSAC